jgi:hypothetical protein
MMMQVHNPQIEE